MKYPTSIWYTRIYKCISWKRMRSSSILSKNILPWVAFLHTKHWTLSALQGHLCPHVPRTPLQVLLCPSLLRGWAVQPPAEDREHPWDARCFVGSVKGWGWDAQLWASTAARRPVFSPGWWKAEKFVLPTCMHATAHGGSPCSWWCSSLLFPPRWERKPRASCPPCAGRTMGQSSWL